MTLEISLAQALELFKPTALFIAGVAVYAIFIFNFYRFIARKEIFELNLAEYNKASYPIVRKTLRLVLYLLEYIIIFPVFVFFWFIVLTLLLSFLAKNHTVNSILLVSIAVVGSIRATAYYNEELSKDLAKMLPFALLGVFLIDINYFVLSESFSMLYALPSEINTMIYYLLFVMCLEFFLRIFTTIFHKRRTEEEQPVQESQ